MSLSTLEEVKGSKLQRYPVDLVDALQTLKYPLTQARPKPRNDGKSCLSRGRVELSAVEPSKPTHKRTNDEILMQRTKRKTLNTVPPLGRTRPHTKYTMGTDFIPQLKKLDMEAEKDREIQRVMNNLRLNKTSTHRAPTTSSKNKEMYGSSRSGMDFTSSLIEGHNLTLRQLREFWSEMPSFLSIQAASLKSKYGMFENGGTDIDDISIEIVKKWNQPTVTFLPQISRNTPGTLQAIKEESVL